MAYDTKLAERIRSTLAHRRGVTEKVKGYVFVAPAGLRGDGALTAWVERGRAFVAESVLGKPAPTPRGARAVRVATAARQRSARRHAARR